MRRSSGIGMANPRCGELGWSQSYGSTRKMAFGTSSPREWKTTTHTATGSGDERIMRTPRTIVVRRVAPSPRLPAPFAHRALPSEHKAWRQPVAAGDIAHRHTRLHCPGDYGQLLLGPEPPTRDTGDDLNFGNNLDIGVCLGIFLGLRLKPLSGRGSNSVHKGQEATSIEANQMY
jgi:hypothetical protein